MASINQVSIDLQVKGQQEVQRAFKNLEKAQDGLNRGIKASVDVSNKNAKSLDRIAREASKAQREMDRLDKAVKKGIITSNQFHGEANRIAARLKNLGMANAQSEVIRYKNALLQARDGSVMLSNATVKATATNDQFENQIRQTTAAVNAQSKANHFAGRRMNAMGMATQQVGYQVGDFLVQVQSGTNAFVAFGQQATQMVGILPLMADSLGVSVGKLIAISSVLGILIPLTTAFAAAISRTGGAGQIFSELEYALEPIRPLIDAIASAMSAIANITIDFANLLVNNLDRIVVTATLVASFFTVKWVAGFVAARIATLSLSAALTVLRAAIVRTGIGALIIGAGELVYQFTRLVKGAGGFGNALKLLVGVASGVWTDIGNGARGLLLILSGAAKAIQASFVSAFAVIGEKWDGLINGMASAWNSIAGTEFGKTLGFGEMGVSDVGGRLRSSAEGLRSEAISQIEKGGALLNSAKSLENTSAAWDKLREAMANADEEGRNIDIRDWFGGAGVSDEDGDGGSGGKGATDRTKDALTELQEKVQSVADTIKDSMSEAFMSMVEGTKSAKDAFRDMARAIIKQLFDILVVQQIVGSFNAQTGVGSGIVGGIMKLFANANGNAFRSGNVIPFANGGVVGSPTMFPMAGNQTGLMGEAGPEAIMPLKRGKGGKLGVVAEGASQPVVIHQNFNFSANGDDSVKRIIAQEAPKIANLTQKQILDQRSRGGVFKTTFG